MNGAVRGITQSRQFRVVLISIGFAGSIWVLSQWIISGSIETLGMGGLIIVMVIIVTNILTDWRFGLMLFIVWLLLEDLARKFLGNNMVIYFGKDALAAVTYISFFVARHRREVESFRPPFLVPLLLFFGLAAMQVFNTESPNVLYGLLGLKLYFYYVPLMFVGYGLLRSSKDLDRFLLSSVVVGFLIAVLGIIQSIVGLKFLNPSVLAPELETLANLTRVSPITGRPVPVPTSVFVSGGRFASYMILVIILAMGTQAYLVLKRRKGSFYGILGIGLALVAAIQSGSRGAIVHTVSSIFIISIAILWGAPWRWGQAQHILKAIRRSVAVGTAGLLLMVLLFPENIGASWAFFSEMLSPYSPKSELQNRAVTYSYENLMKAFTFPRWPIGYGTGTASLGMQYIQRLLGSGTKSLVGGVENGYGALIVEMGILGLILWLLWTTVFLFYAFGVVRRLRETVYFPVAFAIFWYSFLLLVVFTYGGLNAYQNFVMNAYFWVLAGVLFRLPYLAQTPQIVPAQAQIPKLVGLPAPVRSR